MLRRDCHDTGIMRVVDYFIAEAKLRLEAEEQTPSDRSHKYAVPKASGRLSFKFRRNVEESLK